MATIERPGRVQAVRELGREATRCLIALKKAQELEIRLCGDPLNDFASHRLSVLMARVNRRQNLIPPIERGEYEERAMAIMEETDRVCATMPVVDIDTLIATPVLG